MNKIQDMGLINDYTISWSIYLLAAVGVFMVVWRCTRSWPALLRQGLRFAAACVVLVPAQVETANDALAPAFIIAIFDGATGDSEGAATALSSLALAFISGLLLYGVWLGGKRFYRKRRVVKSPMYKSPEKLPPNESPETDEASIAAA